MTESSSRTYCPRDPRVETNLRCGKCGELICPRCLVQTPVGARCPDCAAVRANPVFDPSGADVAKAGAAALIAAAAVSGLAWLVYFIAYTADVDGSMLIKIIINLSPALCGWVVGKTVHRFSGYKRAFKLQIVAGLIVMAHYIAVQPLIGLSYGVLFSLGVGFYLAIGRVKPPRESR